RLGLGVQETLLLHPDTEVRLTGPPQTTASNPNLRQREQSLSRGNLKEVVDGLRRGAPSSSGHQGVAGQVPLIRGRLDRGTKRVRVTPNQVVGNLTVQEAEGGRVLSGARRHLLHRPNQLARLHPVERLRHIGERGDALLVGRDTRREPEANLGATIGGVIPAETPERAGPASSTSHQGLLLIVGLLGLHVAGLPSLIILGRLGGGVILRLSLRLILLLSLLGVSVGLLHTVPQRLSPLRTSLLVLLDLAHGGVDSVKMPVQGLQFSQLLIGR